MPEVTQLIIGVNINANKSLKDINNQIKELSNHPSLQKLKIKLDLDDKTTSILKDFNNHLINLSNSFNSLNNSLKTSSNEFNQYTKAVESAIKAKEKWRIEQQKTTSITENQEKTSKNTSSSNFNFEQIMNTAGTISTIAPSLSEVATVTNVEQLTSATTRASKSTSMLGVSLKSLRLSMNLASVSAVALEAALSLGLSLAITGIVAGLSTLFTKYKEQQQIEKEYHDQQIQSAESFSKQKDKILELVDSYTYLQNTTKNGSLFANSEEEEKYKDTIEQLSKLMPSLIANVDEQGNVHLKNANAIKEEIAYSEKLSNLEKKKSILEAGGNFDKQIKDINSDKKELGYLQDNIEFGKKFNYSDEYMNKLETDLAILEHKVSNSSNALKTDLNDLVQNILDTNNVTIDESLGTKIENLIGNIDISNLDGDQIVERGNAITKIVTDLTKINTSNSSAEINNLKNEIYSIGIKSNISTKELDKLFISEAELSNAAQSSSTATQETAQSVSFLGDEANASLNEIKSLNQILYDLENGQSLSSEAILDLIDQYPELLKSVSKTADGWTIEKNALTSLLETKRNGSLQTKQDEINATQATINGIKFRLDAYQRELLALESLNKVRANGDEALKKATNPLNKNNINYKTVGPYDAVDSLNGTKASEEASVTLPNPTEILQEKIADQEQLFEKEKKKLQTQLDDLAKLQDLINDPNLGISKQSSSSSSKDDPKIQDTIDARVNAINALSETQAKLNEVIKGSISSDENYDKQIEKSTELLHGQANEMKYLEEANSKLLLQIDKLQSANSKFDMSSWTDQNGEATESFIALYNSMTSGTSQDKLQDTFDQYQKYTQAIKDNKSAIEELIPSQTELQKNIDSIKLDRTQNYLTTLTDAISEYDDKVSESQKIQSLYKEGTKEYNDEIKKQAAFLKEKQTLILSDIDWAQKRLKQGDLTNDQIKELNNFLEAQKGLLLEVIVTQNDYYQKWSDSVEDATKDAMQVLEDYYKQQADLETNSLDKQLSAYENYIKDRKKLLNRQDGEEDFQKNREKLQQEQLEIQSKIDQLTLDNSFEATSKREDLQEELQNKLEEISDIELEHARKKRDDNYDDLLEAKQNETKIAKDAVEQKWQNELNTDANYSLLKQTQLEGNIENMRSSLEQFSLTIQSYMNAIGSSIDMNLNQKLASTESFTNLNKSIEGVLSSQPSNSSNAYHSDTQSAWEDYLNNKKMAEEIGSPGTEQFKTLKEKNDELRSQYNFVDGSFAALSTSSLPIFSAREGGMTPSWGTSGKVGILHEQELIMNKVQTKDILKVNEWAQNMIDKIKSIEVSSLLPRAASATGVMGSTYNLTVNLSGSAKQSDADLFVKALRDFDRRR
ncbi:hypothetical protein [Paenibacillus sp. HB172176]|uniref:hypothetical protein n=1 Tax=Paenibacillus sp. HB172176 TaxID=2493690 RepID=UPI00143B6ADB|nr:hypothetical protein [Paenibacillus sp. HB172176]